MARVATEKLSKSYTAPNREEIRAVTEVSLDVEAGELMVLVGPSGSGKTTLLRMIAGLEEPSSGSISMDGTVVTSLPPEDRNLMMVFQDHALYPHMTVYQNLAFGLKLRGHERAESDRRVRQAADLLGLVPALERFPKALSGGERQRVALGRAVVVQPGVFLLDEPLSNLDGPLRAQMRREIARLHRQLGTTMIYVTHDQVEAMALADRMAVMHVGRIEQVGRPMEIYQAPRNLFVAGFVGTLPMNLIEGTLAHRNGALWFGGASESRSHPAGLAFELPDCLKATLGSYRAGPVIFGIRAEHIHEVAPSEPAIQQPTLDATVEIVEPMGAETHLCLAIGPYRLMARVAASSRARAGETIRVALELDRAHFFDAVSGQRLDCTSPNRPQIVS